MLLYQLLVIQQGDMLHLMLKNRVCQQIHIYANPVFERSLGSVRGCA